MATFFSCPRPTVVLVKEWWLGWNWKCVPVIVLCVMKSELAFVILNVSWREQLSLTYFFFLRGSFFCVMYPLDNLGKL